MNDPKPTRSGGIEADKSNWSAEDLARGYTDADMAEVSDNPEWTEADFAAAKPFAEVFPRLARSIGRGPQKAPRKISTTIRLSPEVVSHYRATGKGWQARIDADLKRLIGAG